MIKGWKDKLENYVNLNEGIIVDMKVRGNAVYDFCCFGVDAQSKLSDDRYMVFYNQKRTPQGEIPAYINRLIFTVSIDGTQTMGEMENFVTQVHQPGAQGVELCLTGKDFSKEKAIIAIEIYRKDIWRIGCVAGGFDGGLSALLAHFGGEEIKEESVSASAPEATISPAFEKTSSAGVPL